MARMTSRGRRVKRRNPYKPKDYDTLGQTMTPGFVDLYHSMPASLGSQMFSVVPSFTGAAAMFLLSFKLAKATRLSVTEVAIASLISVIGAVSGILIVKTYH